MKNRFAVALLLLLTVPAARAGTLDGKVVGVNDTPRPYVRVEFHGPQGTTAFSGPDGTFTIQLAAGTYVVQVIQGDRAAQFNLVVPGQGAITQTFKLSW